MNTKAECEYILLPFINIIGRNGKNYGTDKENGRGNY